MPDDEQKRRATIIRLATNPFYCGFPIAYRFTEERPKLISEADFIKIAARLIREIGPEEYLTHLLNNLKGTVGI